MNHYKSSAALKRLSKGQLLGKYSTVILAFLLFTSCIAAVYLFYSSMTIKLDRSIGIIFDLIMQFLLQLFIGIFSVGNAFLYLNIARGKAYTCFDIFAGFKHHADKAIIIQFILTVISCLLLSPYYILSWLHRKSPSGGLFLVSCLVLIIGSAIAVYINIIYCQWTYIALDLPERSAKETMQASRECMRGHKGRRFFVSLSFLPLILLSCLGCFLPLLWVMPYMSATNANFYLDLMENRNAAGQHFDETVA